MNTNIITCGERDKNGFCDTYLNGEKTNVTLKIWKEEDAYKLLNIIDKIK